MGTSTDQDKGRVLRAGDKNVRRGEEGRLIEWTQRGARGKCFVKKKKKKQAKWGAWRLDIDTVVARLSIPRHPADYASHVMALHKEFFQPFIFS